MRFFTSIIHVVRLARAGLILAREGVFLDVDPELLPPTARPFFLLFRKFARRDAIKSKNSIARAMALLGPSYVKLGQFLATRPDIVGFEAARALEELQDRMEPFGRAEAIQTIERTFGQPFSDIFSEFGEPVAAASIAQVHKARTKEADGGRYVAVKVLRPGINVRFRRDLDDMMFAAQMAERGSAEARRLRLVAVVETLARSVSLEMDLRLEAAAASEFRENTAADPGFRTPEVDWNRTGRDVLTTEWIDGVPLSNVAALQAAGLDLPKLGATVIQSFLRHAVRDGFFHADMHQGNLFVDREGGVVAVDFGIMGRLTLAQRKFLAEILFGFITRDYRRVAIVHFDAGYVPRSHGVAEFAQAIRAVGEPIHSRTADQISMAKVLTLLFEITALFDMSTRTELVLLQKTMVVVEGVARTLDPNLNMWTTAEPVIRAWIEENLGPAGKMRDAQDVVGAALQAVARAPQMLDRLDTITENLQARADLDSANVKASSISYWSSLPLWLLAAAAAIALLR